VVVLARVRRGVGTEQIHHHRLEPKRLFSDPEEALFVYGDSSDLRDRYGPDDG
jgi:hypothetical protein